MPVPRVRLECNPEIPVAPGEEHWLLDTSLDEVYWPCSRSSLFFLYHPLTCFSRQRLRIKLFQRQSYDADQGIYSAFDTLRDKIP